jgi:nucleoside 2-deoxyribosyltransferase
VVDPVVAARGLERVEVGSDPHRQGFINTEIFTELHFAATVVADMTEQRTNCAIELGYASARGHEVLLTARRGERAAFDVDKLPFWSRDEDQADLRDALGTYWQNQARRAPVVSGRALA